MIKRNFILAAGLFIFCLAASAAAQTGISGNWEWKSKMDKEKNQTYFSITLKPKNGKVKGNFYFNDLTNGETESDGSATPFIGTVKGDVVTIEFDPDNANPAYEENLKYVKPKGKSPSYATLTLKNGKLIWQQTKGILAEDMPKTFTMNRAK